MPQMLKNSSNDIKRRKMQLYHQWNLVFAQIQQYPRNDALRDRLVAVEIELQKIVFPDCKPPVSLPDVAFWLETMLTPPHKSPRYKLLPLGIKNQMDTVRHSKIMNHRMAEVRASFAEYKKAVLLREKTLLSNERTLLSFRQAQTSGLKKYICQRHRELFEKREKGQMDTSHDDEIENLRRLIFEGPLFTERDAIEHKVSRSWLHGFGASRLI